MINRKAVAVAMAVVGLGAYTVIAQTPAANMSFFVTSSNPKGGNLGGLAGADQVCQALAKTAGAGNKTWRAYLSTSTVDAKSRIGNGPWYNFKGELIAQNVADLHTADKNKISGETALTEKGTLPNYLKMVDGKAAPAAQPLQHDILTGTNEDGTKNADTCNNWTVGDASAKAMLGHADRLGRNPGLNSWNAIHASQGCGQEQLAPTGGAGMLYCFAAN
ncbi:MAG TPA: hypothetical protein VFO31_02330 [Vicinamibacterales bacterium]|nr:hypothetical protein [Vicinamibacterales bacterium]